MPGVRFSAEQQAKAVRLVAEATPQHESEWAAIESVAAKIGASAETVRKWGCAGLRSTPGSGRG